MGAIQQQGFALDSLLTQGLEIKTLPEVYLRMSEQLDDPTVSVQEIGETVRTDAAISSQILRMVNSAYFALPNKIATASQAVVLIGRGRVKQALMSSVLSSFFNGLQVEKEIVEKFWRHSIKTAIIAKQLSLQLKVGAEPDELFVAGLLHDIGSLVMASKLPAALADKNNPGGQTIAESGPFEFDHLDLGAALMDQWNLPELLVTCARHHQNIEYDLVFADANRLIYLSSHLGESLSPIDEDNALEHLEKIDQWKSIGASLKDICYACQLAEEQLFGVMESLGMTSTDAEKE